MRRFEEKDLAQLNEWNDLYGLPHVSLESLPDFGLIIDGICAGFLYETDSKICLFDGFIANPNASKIDRTLCLDVVTDGLLERAQFKGFKSIMAFTNHESIRNRCRRYRFSIKGNYDLFVREK